jgi:hypothetical protein
VASAGLGRDRTDPEKAGHMTFRVLDLFCGAGGCSVGYERGFAAAGLDVDVVGVDLAPQPRYPFRFVQADAMTFPLDGFDLIHASPPCQAFTTMSNRWRGAGGTVDGHPDLIAATRERLQSSDARMWVIENVPGAARRLRSPLTLSGGMFGLGVHRPRLFECSELVMLPQKTDPPAGAVGVYGKSPDGRRLWRRADGSELRAPRSLGEARDAMGIGWMLWHELKEAVPPAYTEYLAGQLVLGLARRSVITEEEATPVAEVRRPTGV